MKSKKGYWIGGVLVLVGGIAGVLWFVTSFMRLEDQVDGFERVPVPGEQSVTLEARKYVVYLENLTGAQVAIADEGGGELAIEPYGGSLTYTFGDREGSAQGTVTPPRAGDYVVTTASDEATGNASVALGESIAGPLVRAIAGTVLVGGVLVLIGVVLLVVTAIRLNRGAPGPPP